MSSQVIIALGGNLGDVRATGAAALDQLGSHSGIDIEQVSPWYSTEPVGCEGRFLNAAARLRCEVTPSQLLRRMQEIETSLGRVRIGHWTPRPIDLDLVLFGTWRINHPALRVPHPAAWYRRFVLDPACDVAGSMFHPDFGLTMQELRNRLTVRPLPLSWRVDISVDQLLSPEMMDKYQSLVRWNSPPQSATLEFTESQTARSASRQIVIPGAASIQASRKIISDTLTAILDEPFAVEQ